MNHKRDLIFGFDFSNFKMTGCEGRGGGRRKENARAEELRGFKGWSVIYVCVYKNR